MLKEVAGQLTGDCLDCLVEVEAVEDACFAGVVETWLGYLSSRFLLLFLWGIVLIR